MHVTIVGKRWFQRSYGNTYHSVVVEIDGQAVFSSGQHYGYGDQYLQTAYDWLNQSGLVPERKQYANGGYEPMWQWSERTGITYSNFVSDVAREKDL